MSYLSHRSKQYGMYSVRINPNCQWDTEIHFHIQEELLYFSKAGSCTVINNGTTVQIETPAFIWNRAGSFHKVTNITALEDSYCSYHHPQFFSDIHQEPIDLSFAGNSGLCAICLRGERAERMEKLFATLPDSPVYQRKLLLLCIFHQAAKSLAPGEMPIHSGNNNSYIYQVASMLQSPDGRKLTIDSLSKEFHVSPTKLKTDFKKFTNIPIHTFRKQQQLHTARAQISTTRKTLAEIAVACGFTDESHLIRAFRAEFGITPGVLRRQHLGRLKNPPNRSDP